MAAIIINISAFHFSAELVRPTSKMTIFEYCAIIVFALSLRPASRRTIFIMPTLAKCLSPDDLSAHGHATTWPRGGSLLNGQMGIYTTARVIGISMMLDERDAAANALFLSASLIMGTSFTTPASQPFISGGADRIITLASHGRPYLLLLRSSRRIGL